MHNRALVVAVVSVATLTFGCVARRGGGGGPPPPPPPPADQPIYASCVTTDDCVAAADACYTITTTTGESAEMCSNACTNDADCALSSTGELGGCYDIGSGDYLCYERCVTDADCTPRFTCQATSAGDAICLPGSGAPPPAANYDTCATVADCNELADDCYTVSYEGVTDSFCSSLCSSDATCPTSNNGLNGACYDVMSSSVYLCYERCDFSSDCAPGFGCFETFDPGTGSTDAICLPA